MTWTIRLTGEAEHALATMPAKHVDPVLTYLFERLVTNPHRMSKPLRTNFAGYRSARVGPDMRVIFSLEPDDVIAVIRIDYRTTAYRSR